VIFCYYLIDSVIFTTPAFEQGGLND